MVSLEYRASYLDTIVSNPKIFAFQQMLLGKDLISDNGNNLSEIDEVYFGLVTAVTNKNKNSFIGFYNRINSRIPSTESPFVHNDFLVFVLLSGIELFALSKEWIKKVLSARSSSDITETFTNISNSNYSSNNNIPEIILAFLDLTNPSLINNEIINRTYNSISNNAKLFHSKNDFNILIAIKSFDIILYNKGITEIEKSNALKEFEKLFLKRTKLISNTLYAAIILAGLYFVIKLVSLNPKIESFLNSTGIILQVIGVGIVGTGLFTTLRKKFYQIFIRVLGYKTPLSDK